ncbi:hypothetical protein [Hymenobacter jejuensis]|uniref:Uncharacterized protein n=1 Tax=Hymenobacter jejuensis TaxID=2502781 RepID=A0A5B7ZW36_9BACT|nr:hypothetical protein [Hymenobacter jejuensis]QDA59039.1 hypothetical protein FHG12_02485 [Hymenobacter jejuensis]
MKNFSSCFAIGALLLGVACSKPGPDDAAHDAVGRYVKTNLPDPESYEVVRFGRSTSFTRQDSAAHEATLLHDHLPYLEAAEARALEQYKKAGESNKASSFFETEKAYKKATEAKLQAQRDEKALTMVRDTTRLGTLFMHTYKAKNKSGAAVVDSAQFLVYKNGAVETL